MALVTTEKRQNKVVQQGRGDVAYQGEMRQEIQLRMDQMKMVKGKLCERTKARCTQAITNLCLVHRQIREQNHHRTLDSNDEPGISFVTTTDHLHVVANFEELSQLEGLELQRLLNISRQTSGLK